MTTQNHSQFADEDARWRAVAARERAADGVFVFAVTTTGIYCRPSCPARRPAREHTRFFTSGEAALVAGFRPCQRCRPDEVSQDRQAVMAALAAIGKAGGPVAMAGLAALTGYSEGHLRAIFQRATGLTPAAYGRAIRLEAARAALGRSDNVAEAIYEAGFGASSRFYEGLKEKAGMAPSVWRRGGAGAVISWAVAPSAFGPVLVAASDKGVCRVAFGVGREDLERLFPRAELVAGDKDFAELVTRVVKAVEMPGNAGDIPLDVIGTAFQEKVWAQLRAIPRGETRSYGEIAAALGQPGASRAVGGANGANPVAVLVPCHRVVQTGGALGGYAWGVAIKRELLARERGG